MIIKVVYGLFLFMLVVFISRFVNAHNNEQKERMRENVSGE